jgi:CBS domain containing-hemolysin-like protein
METITWNIELIVRGVLQALLLFASAVFSGSETALFSLSRTDLQQLRHRRDPHSESIHAMLDEPRRLIISILCGNELVNVASSANMAAILLILFGQDAGWINILVMVPLLLLIGEVTPKTIAVNHPTGFSRNISARILPRWIYLVTPLREAVRQIADRVTTRLVGESVSRENILKPDELKTLLEEGEATGIIDASERVLIDNLLEASQTDVLHIMTPGPRLCLLDADQPLPDLIRTFRGYQHPRVPVYRGHWDNVVGFIHSEDVLRLVRGGADLEELRVETILRPAHFLPQTVKVDELFHFFQTQGTRAAIVLGEFGEVIGIVTMQDVLSFIFGELTTDIRGSEEYERTEQGHIVPGWMRLLDFYSLTNIDLEDPVMTTIGGLVFRLFGRLPEVGEAVDHEGYHFHVLGIDGLRISRVEVSKVAVATPEPESEALADDGEAGQLPRPEAARQGASDAAATVEAASSTKRGDKKRKGKKQHKRARADEPGAASDSAEAIGDTMTASGRAPDAGADASDARAAGVD